MDSATSKVRIIRIVRIEAVAAPRLAHDRIPFDADALGAENRVYFSTGPLQMSRMSFTGRMNATGLSPLTDGLLSTNAGGYLSRNFADTGYSAVEVVGQSDELLAIHVTDDGVEFEEVPNLEKATVPAVTEYVKRERQLDAENVISIGPVGENLVRYASIMTYGSRAFGRGGLGAVLGSKNVKAITFEGDSAPEIDLAEGVRRIHDELGVDDYTAKGLEFAAHDGRVIQGQGFAYSVANRGGDHMYSTMYHPEYNGKIPAEGLEGKPEIIRRREDHAAVRDSGIVCAFSANYLTGEHLEQLLQADYEDELLEIGSGVIELERHFNNKRGFDRGDDQLPYELPGFEAALEEYYELRGWNDDGTVPDGRITAYTTADD